MITALFADFKLAQLVFRQAQEHFYAQLPVLVKQYRFQFSPYMQQSALAALIGRDATYVSRIESGRLRPPEEVIEKLIELESQP